MNERYAFASDLDGNSCLIAPAGTTDWEEWTVESVDAEDTRERISPKRGFHGLVYAGAEASWPIEFLCHVEVSIPGVDKFVVHPLHGIWFPQKTCPVCGWNPERARREQAERLAREAHETAQKAAREDRASKLVKVARDELDTSRYEAALTVLDAALDMYRSTGNVAAYADTLLATGEAMLRFGLRTEAVEAIRAARRIVEQVGSMRDQASATKLLADALSDLGEFDRSIALYAEAQDRFRQLADHDMVAIINMELGIVVERIGRFGDARECYEEALGHFREMVRQYDVDIASCQLNLSTALAKLGESERAQAALREAHAIYSKAGMVREATDCQVNLANALWRQGQLAEARELNEAARRVYRELKLPTEAADCADHIGAMLADQGDYEAALPYHLRARAVYDEYYFDISSAIATYNYAHALFHLGRHKEADAELQRAINICESHNCEYQVATNELLRASVLASLGQHADAMSLVESARQRLRSLGDEEAVQGCDTIEGEVLRKAGRARDAVPCLERAVVGCTKSGNPLALAEAELELALALRDLGDPSARTHADQACRIFQEHDLPLRVQEVSELMGET